MPLQEKTALLHGHCHQKAFRRRRARAGVRFRCPISGDADQVELLRHGWLRLSRALRDVVALAELSLLPAVRKDDADT